MIRKLINFIPRNLIWLLAYSIVFVLYIYNANKWVWFSFFVIGVYLRLLAGRFDRMRISGYVKDRGGRLLSVTYTSYGGFPVESFRYYIVRYSDRAGNQREAICKTMMLTKVLFLRDHIVAASFSKADE